MGTREHAGAAAGLGYGLQAAVTKTFVTLVGSGIVALVTSWTIYVLVLAALSGFDLEQSALKTGCSPRPWRRATP